MQFIINQKMEPVKSLKSPWCLALRSVTWYKNSHSLFDYESNKISTTNANFTIGATKSIALYRKRQASQVVAFDEKAELLFDPEDYQFLTKFRLAPEANNKYLLQFFNDPGKKTKEVSSERVNTEESKSNDQKEEETYVIVRKQKDLNGDPKGYRLEPGQTIKLGRVEFYVSEVSIDSQVGIPSAASKNKFSINGTVFKYRPSERSPEYERHACKICLEEEDTEDDFLFNPCKCTGSCGAVHLKCLLQWISIKVKKQVVGGTLHYNFEKFECEVCKTELPIRIETEKNQTIDLLPIEKPKGNYIILQGACQKTKSVMMIQNVPLDGIKLGRGHECQIRITDISVSRNHAMIKFINGGFYVFDNKSKFGTLVKEERMEVAVTPEHSQAIQIGRTVVILEVRREADLKEKQLKSTKNAAEKIDFKFVDSKKSIDRR